MPPLVTSSIFACVFTNGRALRQFISGNISRAWKPNRRSFRTGPFMMVYSDKKLASNIEQFLEFCFELHSDCCCHEG